MMVDESVRVAARYTATITPALAIRLSATSTPFAHNGRHLLQKSELAMSAISGTAEGADG